MIDDSIYQSAQSLAKQGKAWDEFLQQQSGLSADEVCTSLATQQVMQYLTAEQLETFTVNFEWLSYEESVKKHCFFATDTHQTNYLVLSHPWATDTVTQLWAASQQEFTVAFTRPTMIHSRLQHYALEHKALATWSPQATDANGSSILRSNHEHISLQSLAHQDSEVVKLVNGTLYDAFKSKASDIHLETSLAGLTIRYRLDGVLVTIRKISNTQLADQVLSRLKVLAELDIGERRIPQDGRFAATINERAIDFRVSIMPNSFGEDAVLRILDKQQISDQQSGLNLNVLGLDESIQKALHQLAAQPYGMLLVTGPTGSGKTTTLYAILNETHKDYEKVITIEDPVEYQLEGTLQIPVNERKGLTFAKGLRSILRHDPDKILVGEIRDQETGEIAVQAALTGHLVYTTVHANNVFDVISRFKHIGVDTVSFVSALNGIVAQRLIRLLCQHCNQPDLESPQYRIAVGCGLCRGTGYSGRRAIAEVLMMTDEIKELMLDQAPTRKLKEIAMKQGMRSMREWAFDAVARGETTVEEINRVTFAD